MIDLSRKYDHYRRRLGEAMASRALTNEEMAARMGAHPVTVSKLRGGRITLDDEWRAKAALAIGLAEDILFGDELLPEPAEHEVFRPTKRRGRKPAAVNDNNMLPVYGMAAGALRGHYVMTTEVIEMIPCPPGLSGVEGAYALIVTGTSMVPRYMPKEILYINPLQKIVSGDHVVIQVQNHEGAGTETWVKRYDATVDDEIVVTQYNPEARMRFRQRYVHHMHRVLPVNELFPAR